jgi:hypothetical protein
LLLLLRVPRRERYPAGQLAVQADLEGILAGTGKGNIEHQYCTGLDVDHTGRRLPELDRSLAAQELTTGFVDEADSDGVHPDFGSAAPDPQYQMRSGVYCRKVRKPYVLEHAQHTQLALLVNEGIVGHDRKIEMQLS